MKKDLIIVTGPTGVGKTDFVDSLLQKIDGEVINIDMGQFYEPISIGTAKPDYKNSKYKQHLFDIIKEPKNFTVIEYRRLILDKVNELWSKNKTSILVGGSAFYINSLLFPPIQTINKKIDNAFSNKSTQNLWQELDQIDNERAKQINKNDRYRIERALTIWYQLGKKPSELQPKLDVIADKVYIFILVRDMQELYSRINSRTIEMINSGWITEIENLSTEWKSFLKEKKIIGYDDIIDFINDTSKYEKEEHKNLIETIQQKTRNYAKRQMTFFRKLEKDIKKTTIQNSSDSISLNWINLSDKDFDLYIDSILDKILKL